MFRSSLSLITFLLVFVCGYTIYQPLKAINAKAILVEEQQLVSWLVKFYGISTLVGYLMPNTVYAYVLIYMIYKCIFWREYF